MTKGVPRAKTLRRTHVGNGRKPTVDDATTLEIKRKKDAGRTDVELAEEYGLKSDTIRRALLRAEFVLIPRVA